jgi:hypothetical protein
MPSTRPDDPNADVPAANQRAAAPPVETHETVREVPELADLNVGARDPQAPSHPAAGGAGSAGRGGGIGDAGGVIVPSTEAALGTSEDPGPEDPPPEDWVPED